MSKRTTSSNAKTTDRTKATPDAFGMSPADYARLQVKTDVEIATDCQGDPDASPPASTSRRPMRRIARVKLIRERLHLSQSEFAAAFRIPLGTVRDWEQHKTEPDSAMRAYLAVIAAEPEMVRKALHAKPAA